MKAGEPVSSLTGNAGFLLSRVGTAVQTGFKELLGRWNIRPQHFAILMALGSVGEASQQQLCQALGIDSGNMVELIDTLEALRFVQRSRDTRDRRRYVLAMTPEGQAALAAVTEAIDDFTRRFLEPLSQAEQATLISSLAKLYATTPEGQRQAAAQQTGVQQ
jgi:DNA-binding MarR family transcriptional regulator